ETLSTAERLNKLESPGRVVTDATKEILCHSLSVVEAWQSTHATSNCFPETWRTICRKKSSRRQHYSPRWTFPILYFRMPIAEHFVGATGLDVGARVSRSIPPVSSLRVAVPPDFESEDLKQCFVPHYIYYVDIGCRMEAIDMTASAEDGPIKYGDARMLLYPAESFDFVTAPMLLGPQNVCATPIEIALCVSEFRRVLRPGGFLYLADPMVEPSVIYAAQHSGFDCYYSKGRCCGLPVGTMFRRRGSSNTTDRFEPLFEHLKNSSLMLSDRGEETVWSGDLLWDQQPPSVHKPPSPVLLGLRRR
ncbi:MAG: class I SAM-dependent methyltransferase, partial [Terriglobia bacterium]